MRPRAATIKEPQMDAAAEPAQDLKQTQSPPPRPLGFFGLCLSLVALAVLCLLLSALGLAIGVAIAGPVLGWPQFIEALQRALAASDDALATRLLMAVILIFYLSLVIAVFIAARWRGKGQWRALTGWEKFTLSDRSIWIIMVLALIYSASASDLIGHFLSRPAEPLKIPADPYAAVALFVLAVMLAPVTEELLFRGWIFTALRFNWGFWPALLVTSMLFALAHYENTHLYALAVFPIGLALGAIRERAGSVKAAILFHGVNNLAAFVLSAFGGG
jgi:membrane protease YdiL (CAAX protease family)